LLRERIAVLRRRKWIVLVLLLVAPATTLILSARQEPLYESSTQLILSRQSLGNALLGVSDAQVSGSDFDRLMQTQVQVAESPVVAAATARAIDLPGRSPDVIAARTTVEGSPDSDVLTITATDPDRGAARRIAGRYADEYIAYRRRVDGAAVTTARRDVQSQIRALEARSGSTSQLWGRLVEKSQELRTLETLQSANATVASPPSAAVQIRPTTQRDLALGLFIGVVFALSAAFLAEALDTRLRSVGDVAATLRHRWLGSVPRPRRPGAGARSIVLRTNPLGADAEAFRMLRTNIDLVRLDLPDSALLVTSAGPHEGKSTTVANLGMTWALSGQRVVLVDLDLREPSLHRYLGVPPSPGIVDVALGAVSIDEALREVPLPEDALTPHRSGSLHVLTAGRTPPDPGDFVGGQRVGEIVAAVKERADVVLVDSPPLLLAGDAAAIGRHVDAVLAVVRESEARRGTLAALGRALDLLPAPTIGFVLTGTDRGELYDSGLRSTPPERTDGHAERDPRGADIAATTDQA
jgi:capsular exopolysaccharide synthesis family protein